MITKNFKDRDKELTLLNEAYKTNKSKLIILYGRRRVGKTELLKEFLIKNKGLYLLARQESEKEQLEKFSEQISEYFNDNILKINPFKNWDALFTYLSEKPKVPIIFDEFPYLVQSSKKLPSILQDYWDNKFSKINSFMILCGSSIMMMESLLGHKSPLYGRRTEQILLEPLKFSEACLFFPEKKSLKEKIIYFSILGGIPAYLLEFDYNKSLKENLMENLLRKNKFLYEDVMFIIKEELKEPRNYFSILNSIAKGNTKVGNIVNDTGLEKSFVNKYLSVLIKLQIIERRVPITEKNLMNSRRGLYFLKDNFFKFWFRFVFENQEYIEQDRQEILIENKIMPELNAFIGRIFEDIILSEIIKKEGYKNYLFGRWWSNELESELVGIDKKNKEILIGEVKFSKLSRSDIFKIEKSLKEKARFININGFKENYLIVCLEDEEYKVNFAKSKKTAKFSEESFENSLGSDNLANYSEFSKGDLNIIKFSELIS
jgi:AAA+ ATPase superfamily predicted ATPase